LTEPLHYIGFYLTLLMHSNVNIIKFTQQ